MKQQKTITNMNHNSKLQKLNPFIQGGLFSSRQIIPCSSQCGGLQQRDRQDLLGRSQRRKTGQDSDAEFLQRSLSRRQESSMSDDPSLVSSNKRTTTDNSNVNHHS